MSSDLLVVECYPGTRPISATSLPCFPFFSSEALIAKPFFYLLTIHFYYFISFPSSLFLLLHQHLLFDFSSFFFYPSFSSFLLCLNSHPLHPFSSYFIIYLFFFFLPSFLVLPSAHLPFAGRQAFRHWHFLSHCRHRGWPSRGSTAGLPSRASGWTAHGRRLARWLTGL